MHSAFKFHKLTPRGQEKAKLIAQHFDELLQRLLTTEGPGGPSLVPAGRLQALVITKLEEASFFAKKAMAESESAGEA